MSKSLFTDEVLQSIPGWLLAGESLTTIATRIGCTVGTLTVVCSKLHISLRRPKKSLRLAVRDGELSVVTVTLPKLVCDALTAKSVALSKSNQELLSLLISKAVDTLMFEALLNGQATSDPSEIGRD